MLNLLDVVFEYQSLRARRDVTAVPLDDVERARLIGLERLLAAKSRVRMVPPVPVQITIPGGFGGGEVHTMSHNGVAMTTTQKLARGTRTALRITQPDAQVEYVFPGRVVTNRGGVLGVAFDGVPTKAPYRGRARVTTWRRDMRFGVNPETNVA